MTLPDTLAALLGDGNMIGDPAVADAAANDLAQIRAADALAAALQQVSGVFFLEPETLDAARRCTAQVAESLARDFSNGLDLGAVDAAVRAVGKVPFGEGHEALSDLIPQYAWFHSRASFYLGLCVGWRAAQTLGGARMTPAERARIRREHARAGMVAILSNPAITQGPAPTEELSRETWNQLWPGVAASCFELADAMLEAEGLAEGDAR